MPYTKVGCEKRNSTKIGKHVTLFLQKIGSVTTSIPHRSIPLIFFFLLMTFRIKFFEYFFEISTF
jgi:hypothetical protein